MEVMTGLCGKMWDVQASVCFCTPRMCVNVFGAKERVVGCLHKPEGLRILVAAERATTSSHTSSGR